MKINNDVSQALYILKGYAIVSVICAHCFYRNPILQNMTSICGLLGVPIFLICAGLLLDTDKTITELLKGKILSVILPWIFYGIITYFISTKFKGVDFTNMVLWIFGYKTWLYYVPVYLVCIILVHFFKNNALLVISIIVCIISNILTNIGVLNFDVITPYQNPINWIGFISIGVYLRRNNFLMYGIRNCSLDKKIVLSFSFIIIQIIGYFILLDHGFVINYWNLYSILFEITGFYFLYLLSYKMINSSFFI